MGLSFIRLGMASDPVYAVIYCPIPEIQDGSQKGHPGKSDWRWAMDPRSVDSDPAPGGDLQKHADSVSQMLDAPFAPGQIDR